MRDEGSSKEKAARITDADRPGRRGGWHPQYEDWTLNQIYGKTQHIGIPGGSGMDKDELIRALGNH